MKTKLLFILLFLFNLSVVKAQREAGIWYFGYEAGLDFNSGSPVALTDGKLITGEGCATISDFEGNLLFYTDGKTVWNAKHHIMPNGNGLLGHSSSTQSAIIIPNPTIPNIYYIFTVDEPNPSNADDNPLTSWDDGVNDGLNYTEVNMNLAGGLGDVNPLKKNIHLITYNKTNKEEAAYKCSEKITAVQHADGNSVWVVSHFLSKFYSFRVSAAGVNTIPKTSISNTVVPIGGYILNSIGYLKSSPNGKKLGIVHMATRKTNETNPKTNLPIRNSGKVLLYDFNNLTGEITNPTTILSGTNPYGLEFSSRTKKVYVTANNYTSDGIVEGSSLYQYNLENSSIPSTKKVIEENTWIAGALQLAIDEKIYRAGYPSKVSSNSEYLSVINYPEKDGNLCDFKLATIDLKGKKVIKGLPPFIQSLFLSNFKYEFTCLGDATHFFISTFEPIDSVIWDFGDGTTSTDLDAYHTYNRTGTYSVSLTKIVNGELKDPITKEVIIRDKPLILNSIYQFVQCDSYDDNPNDEIAIFNLESTIDPVTLNNSDSFDVFFYLNETAAENDIFNLNSLPKFYRNTIPKQVIVAKVVYKGSNCASMAKIELIAVKSETLDTIDLKGCDLGDGTAEFDFNLKSSDIISVLNLPSSITFTFFDSEENAMNNFAPLPNNYISSEKKIFFRAENNGICYGAGTFNLKIKDFPSVESQETINICENDFPQQLSVPIPLSLQQNYNYLWSTGGTGSTISLENEQEISVIITDKEIGCEKIKKFSILKVTKPIITNAVVDINTKTATIFTAHNFENTYALDDEPYFQTSNIFSNLTPGVHYVSVKNKFNCGITKKKIFVLGFPKYMSPNNDGTNDTWRVLGLNFEEYNFSKISIFDRYGKLLITMNPNSSWNGLYNNNYLTSSDYWFIITVTDKKSLSSETYKGHFSLIR